MATSSCSIGGNHILPATRRNIDLNIICVNNFNYGMTGRPVRPDDAEGTRRRARRPKGEGSEDALNLVRLMALARGGLRCALVGAARAPTWKVDEPCVQKKGQAFIRCWRRAP